MICLCLRLGRSDFRIYTMISEGRKLAQDINNRFVNSSYGFGCPDSPRWTKYDLLSGSGNRIKIGAETTESTHTGLMIGLAHNLISGARVQYGISEEEELLLYQAISMQDWGKRLCSDGNIPYDQITNEDTKRWKERFGILYDDLIEDGDVKEKYIIESAIFDSTSKLGQILDSIKRVAYMRVAVIVYEQAKSLRNRDNELADVGYTLAADVISNQLVKLINQAEQFPGSSKFLECISPTIDDMFAEIDVNSLSDIDQRTKVNFQFASDIWERTASHSSAQIDKGSNGKTGIFGDQSSFEKRFLPNYEDVSAKVAAIRSLGGTIVLTSGSFDLIHIGHARYLEKASSFGDFLIVGVDSDEKIQSRKGPKRPIIGQEERLRMVAQLRGVDLITIKPAEEKKWELIERVHPDVLIVTAETYTSEQIKLLEGAYCGKVIVLEPQATTSTSARIRKMELDAFNEATTITTQSLGQYILSLIENGASIEQIAEYVRTLDDKELSLDE